MDKEENIEAEENIEELTTLTREEEEEEKFTKQIKEDDDTMAEDFTDGIHYDKIEDG